MHTPETKRPWQRGWVIGLALLSLFVPVSAVFVRQEPAVPWPSSASGRSQSSCASARPRRPCRACHNRLQQHSNQLSHREHRGHRVLILLLCDLGILCGSSVLHLAIVLHLVRFDPELQLEATCPRLPPWHPYSMLRYYASLSTLTAYSALSAFHPTTNN